MLFYNTWHTLALIYKYLHMFTKNHWCFKCHITMFKPNMATVFLQIGMSFIEINHTVTTTEGYCSWLSYNVQVHWANEIQNLRTSIRKNWRTNWKQYFIYTLKNMWSIMHRQKNDPFSDPFLRKITILWLFFSEKGQKKDHFVCEKILIAWT